jgi:hypothetical protein
MAIVKATYTRARKAAKRNVGYIAHRPGKNAQRGHRQLFSQDGPLTRSQAYRLIDQAPRGSVFFRFVISPDPATEDQPRDLHLRALTDETFQKLEGQTGKAVEWVAAVHDDHTPHRHIHALAVVHTRVEKEDLEAMIEAASQTCQAQRRQLDAIKRKQLERKRAREEAWDRDRS